VAKALARSEAFEREEAVEPPPARVLAYKRSR
jgi:hypothetical protein